MECRRKALADTTLVLVFTPSLDAAGRYTPVMSTTPSPAPAREVRILVLDDDVQGQAALRQILDSEGWRVRIVPDTRLLMTELKSGEWSLVIANMGVAGLNSPLFFTLKELSGVSVEEGARLRILYLVPEKGGSQLVSALEFARLPYVVRPFHLHDFLEKVSDLLVEIKAIEAPLRQVRHEFGEIRKKMRQTVRATSMFAPRDSFTYSEEEIAEYERSESEATKAKRNRPRTNLGDPGNR
jgi:DNA-binding response OmpR family regulator